MPRKLIKKCKLCSYQQSDATDEYKLALVCSCSEYTTYIQAPKEPQYKVWCLENDGSEHWEYLMEGPEKHCHCIEEYETLCELGETLCECIWVNSKMDLWITIRPPGAVEEYVFIKKMRKLMKSQYINPGTWMSFEWKHNEQHNKGIHCHIWAITKGGTQRLRQHIRRSAKGWNTDIKTYPEEYGVNKEDYITGKTWDDEKSKMKQIQDVARRKKLNLMNFEIKRKNQLNETTIDCVSNVSE